MSYAAIAVAVIGAATSAYGAYRQGQVAKDTAEFNAKVANNAAIDARNRGIVAADEHRQKVQKLLSTQRAGLAASGLVTNTGTALSLQTETAGMGELDALRLLNNANAEAEGFTTKSKLLRYEGEQSQIAGSISAAGSLLSSASNAYFSTKGGSPSNSKGPSSSSSK